MNPASHPPDLRTTPASPAENHLLLRRRAVEDGVVRVVCSVLAALAAIAMVVAGVVAAVAGEGGVLFWLVVGPLPFYLVGLVGFLLRPENLPVRWILVSGSCFAIESCLGDVALYRAARIVCHPAG